jgi:hypothetical protein
MFAAFYLIVFLCTPIEYEVFELESAYRATTNNCGVLSQMLFYIRGSAWTRGIYSDLILWISSLAIFYMFSSVVVDRFQNKK